MALSSYFSSYQASASIKNDHRSLPSTASYRSCIGQRRTLVPSSINNELFGQQVREKGKNQCIGCSFLGRSSTLSRPNSRKDHIMRRKGSVVYASFLSGIPSSEIASTAFTWGTAAVLPFYTCMVVAPKTEFAKKVASSSMPYIVLGTLYCYLLYLSWTPDTIRLMFASKYWLPELPGMANLFSSEMTLASAWIHLLAVDLFAARQVYHDGLRNNIETRHSVTLCLMSCPIGILAHLITKALSRNRGETEHRK